MAAEIEWFAVDWGTSNLRVWGVSAEGETVFTQSSDNGMNALVPNAFLPTLLTQLPQDFAPEFSRSGRQTNIVICGMAGARQGWVETPYLNVPASLGALADGAVTPRDTPANLAIKILPGVAQHGDIPDVMRGEETQVLGFLSMRPKFSGTICMPGTHSKWVRVSEGRIVGFKTVMTGELFALLTTHSVLRHSIITDNSDQNFENGAECGIETGLKSPEHLTSNLFRARSFALLSGRSASWCKGYLSGLLIGSEVAVNAPTEQKSVPIIGAANSNDIYANALKELGIANETVYATVATLSGLKAAREQMK